MRIKERAQQRKLQRLAFEGDANQSWSAVHHLQDQRRLETVAREAPDKVVRDAAIQRLRNREKIKAAARDLGEDAGLQWV